MKPLVCKYCGKTHLNLDNLVFKTNKEAEAYASSICECEEGKEFRNLKISMENLDKFLNSTSYSKETKDFLNQCGLYILSFSEDKISYQFENTKIKFSVKNGKLKIEIVETDKTEKTF